MKIAWPAVRNSLVIIAYLYVHCFPLHVHNTPANRNCQVSGQDFYGIGGNGGRAATYLERVAQLVSYRPSVELT